MKAKILNGVILLLLTVSFLLFMYPHTKMKILGYNVDKAQQTSLYAPQEIANKINHDPLSIRTPSIKDMLWQTKEETYKIGELYVPSVSLTTAILAGVNTDSLNRGATSVFIDRKPEHENIVLLGHHVYDETLLFGPLVNAQIGETVEMVNKTKRFHYKIARIKTIHQSEVNILENTKEPQLTLITCDTPVYTENRIAIQCELTHVETVKKEVSKVTTTIQNKKTTNDWSLLYRHFGGLFVIYSMFLLFLIIVTIYLKKSEN